MLVLFVLLFSIVSTFLRLSKIHLLSEKAMKKYLICLTLMSGVLSFAQTTPNLGLQLPIQGSPGWGNSLNQNFMAIDQWSQTAGLKNVTGTADPPTLPCTSTSNNTQIYTSTHLNVYQCSNVTGSYTWNIISTVTGPQTQNLFWASPNGSTGTVVFRAIVPADIPTLNQNTTGTAGNITATTNSTLTSLPSLTVNYSQLFGTAPTWNQNTTGTAANITATSNSTLTTLPSLSLPYSQLSGSVPTWNQNTTGNAATATNANQLLSATWASPPAIGTGTPAAATFTTTTAQHIGSSGTCFGQMYTVASPVTQYNLVSLSSTGISPSGTSGGPVRGIAQATASSGTIDVCFNGQSSVVMDGTTIVGDIVVPSTTIGGEGHDSGQTSSNIVPLQTGDLGIVATGCTGSPCTAVVVLKGADQFGRAPYFSATPPSGFVFNIPAMIAFYDPFSAIDVMGAGAKGDGRTGTAGTTVASSTTVTGLSGVTSGDVGKVFVGNGAGTAPPCSYTLNGNTVNGTVASGNCPLVTTITAATPPNQVTVALAPSQSLTGTLSWVIGTDDHDAIIRAMQTAYINNSVIPALPLKFPKPAGAFYLTSPLPWQGYSMYGEKSPGTNNAIQSVLRGMPGQDLFVFPDHTLNPPSSCTTPAGVPGCFIARSTRVQSMQWTVDDSMDVSGSHLHRWPGRWVVDAVFTSGSSAFTSAKGQCTAGDVAQPIKVIYSDNTFQNMVLTSCNVHTATVTSFGTGLNGNVGTDMTMASITPVTSGTVQIQPQSNQVWIVPTPMTSYSINNNTVTMKGPSLNFFSGETITLNGFVTSPASTWNGTTITVLSTGLGSTQFEFTESASNQGSTNDAGNATITSPSNGYIALIPTFPTNQQVTVTSGGGTNLLTLSASNNCQAICTTVPGSFYNPTAAQATESQSGTTLYISAVNAPVTETIGNAALAVDDSTGGQSFAQILLGYAKADDFYISSSSGADSGNHAAGIYLQGAAGLPYGMTLDSFKSSGPEWGFFYGNPDLTPGSANVGADYISITNAHISNTHPVTIYNGEEGTVEKLELNSAGAPAGLPFTMTGFQLLQSFTTNADAPVTWHIKIPEMEQAANSVNFRLEGRDHIVMNTSAGSSGVWSWNASASKCISCPLRGGSTGTPTLLLVNGIQNDIESLDSINQITVSDDVANGNRITGLRSTSTGANTQPSRSIMLNNARDCKSSSKSADFTQGSMGAPYLNKCDLWWWPNDFVLGSGVHLTLIPDPSSETGYYQKFTANGSIQGNSSNLSTFNYIGVNIPAKQNIIEVKSKAPSLTSFTIDPTVVSSTRLTLTGVAVSGGNAVYSYSAIGAQPNPFVGEVLGFGGFTNSGNNGAFTITAVSGGASGTVTVAATTQVNETHAGTTFAAIHDFGTTTINGVGTGYTVGKFTIDLTPSTWLPAGATLVNPNGAVNQGAYYVLFTLGGLTSSELDMAWMADKPYQDDYNGYTPENAANKGANNGYAPLGSTAIVPTANLPTATTSTLGLVQGGLCGGSNVLNGFNTSTGALNCVAGSTPVAGISTVGGILSGPNSSGGNGVCPTGQVISGFNLTTGAPVCVSLTALPNTLNCLDGFDHLPCTIARVDVVCAAGSSMTGTITGTGTSAVSGTCNASTGYTDTVFFTNSTGGTLQLRTSGNGHVTATGTGGTFKIEQGVSGSANQCPGNSSVSLSTGTTSKYTSAMGGTGCSYSLQNGETFFYGLPVTSGTGSWSVEMHVIVERME